MCRVRWFGICLLFLVELIGVGILGMRSALANDLVVPEPSTDSSFAPDKVFSIAFSNESYPHQFINEQGQPDGIMKDFWQLWADKQGVAIRLVPMSWQKTLDSIRSGDVDLHAGLSFTHERTEFLTFSTGIFPTYSFIYLNESLPSITHVDQLTPYSVGVVRGSSHSTTLHQANPRIQQITFDTRAQMYEAAMAKEILAFSELERLDDNFNELAQLNVLYPRFRRINYQTSDYAAGLAKDDKHMLSFVNQGIQKITLAERQSIENKWLKSQKTSVGITLVYTDNLAPYMGHSASGQPQGLFIDIWRLWSSYTGMPVTFIGDTMERALEQVISGRVDAHIAYPGHGNVNERLAKAAKVYEVNSGVFVSQALQGIENLDQLTGKKLGVFVTSPYLNIIKQEYPAIELIYFTNHQDMIHAAERGEIDAAISEVENMHVKLVNANLQSLFYLLDKPRFSVDIFALLNKENEALADYIREGFESIPKSELWALEDTWLTVKENSYFREQGQKVDLNAEQVKWVLENSTIKVGVVKDWEPLEFVDEQGRVKGINIDIINKVAESVGLKLQIVTYDTWTTLLDDLYRGDVDVILGASQTEQRESFLTVSEPYLEAPWSIIHKQSLDEIRSIRDFDGKQLAIIKDYQLIDHIRRQYPNIYLTVVESIDEGVRAVQQNVADGFIEVLPVASKVTNQESLVPLKISVVPELPLQDYRIALRKEQAELKTLINEGLMNMSDQERQTILDRWFSISIQTGLDQRWVTKIAAQLGFVIFIIIAIIVYWNRKLRQEVGLRRELETQMKHMATHDELTGIANRNLLKSQMEQAIALHQRQGLKLAVLFVDLDGFKQVNDEHGHEVGDQVLKEVAKRLQGCVRRSDTVCRFGGDEFILLLTSLNNREEAGFIAEKVIKFVSETYRIGEIEAKLGSSIGIAMYPDDGQEGGDLLKMADTLMYRVKASGKNGYLYRK